MAADDITKLQLQLCGCENTGLTLLCRHSKSLHFWFESGKAAHGCTQTPDSLAVFFSECYFLKGEDQGNLSAKICSALVSVARIAWMLRPLTCPLST